MFETMLAQRKDHSLGDLSSLRAALNDSELTHWVKLLNRAHPWVKVKVMYRVQDKYDALLSRYFFGASHDHYFDQVCLRVADINRLDTTFLSLCYYLLNLGRLDGFNEERMHSFRREMIRMFTHRDYVLNEFGRRVKPEDVILRTIELNGFIQWHQRVSSVDPRTGRQSLSLEVAKAPLLKLLYGSPKALNAGAYEHLLLQAMQQPGKLLTFLN